VTTNVPAPEMSSSSGAGHPTIAAAFYGLDTVLAHNVRLTQKLAQAEAERDSWRAMSAGGGA
jgi:hypothetical protein